METIFLATAIVAIGADLTVGIGAYVVARITKSYAEQLTDDGGLEAGGRVIGYCERLLIYVFVLVDAPGAIGFLVAAKSIFRFGDITGKGKRRHAEYVIIGTLASFGYAVTTSYLVRAVLHAVTGGEGLL